MAVIRQGSKSPYAGKVMTTRGPRDPDKRLCMQCGEMKPDGLFTINGYGQAVCPDCAGPKHARVLDAFAHKTDCDDGVCTCVDREPEDGRLEDAELPDA